MRFKSAILDTKVVFDAAGLVSGLCLYLFRGYGEASRLLRKYGFL